jgi:hypothetical protein
MLVLLFLLLECAHTRFIAGFECEVGKRTASRFSDRAFVFLRLPDFGYGRYPQVLSWVFFKINFYFKIY